MTSPATGRSLELYYIDGRPEGMLTAEMFNWTGHVLMLPRTQLAQALARVEATYAGVYLLLGERDGEPLAYVGESEDIGSRIKSHDAGKDWWSLAVLITTAGNKLNKAHARYLEARMIAEARAIGRTMLENGTNPPRPPLSEADVSKMEAFLENIFLVLPAVRVDTFIQRARPKVQTIASQINTAEVRSTRFVLNLKKHGITARAFVQEGEIIVEAGSMARLNWEGQGGFSGYAKLYDELRRAGILAVNGTHCVFSQNYAFTSPSAAAAVITGRQTNGAEHWRTEPGDLSYKDWEAQQLTSSTGQG